MQSRCPRGSVLVVLLMVLVALAATGCAKQPAADGTGMETQPAMPASQDQAGGEMAEMTCPMCNKGAPVAEAGSASDEDGVQVVRITQKDGYYSPNEITVKAGMPARLVFTGDAKDCSGKPKVKGLDKQVDFTQTGEATMELDALTAGTYEITCGMDSPGGRLIVQ